MTGRVTSRDVAELAGVSQSAVSRVFSGASASARTAQRVRAAAEELGYRPNILARSLITGRSRIVGLVVAYLENPFFPDVLERFSHALQAEGYRVMVFFLTGQSDADRVVQDMLDHQVDAIVAASAGISDAPLDRARAAGIPVVLFNRGRPGGGVSQITSANRTGAARVARALVVSGHRRIGHIAGWQGSMTGRDRAQAFVEALEAEGIVPVAVESGDYRRGTAADAALRILDAHAPDALFVGNDHMAFAVLDALKAQGVDVPGEVSVVGYDDVPMASWPSFDLTTVRQPAGRMVKAAVREIMVRLDDPASDPQTIEIEGELILRGSARITQGDL
ncbi:MAG: LacI family DNA-binding transcriptional regulator [Shimia sp.]